MTLKNLNHKKSKAFLAIFLAILFYTQASAKSISDNALGITNLMAAAIDGDLEGVKFFSKVDASQINKTSISGSSALNLSCRKDNYAVVEALINAGADVNIADNEGWTPLMRAARAGNEKIIQKLLANHANPYALNDIGESSLIQAAKAECFKCFTRIYEATRSNINFIQEQGEVSYKIAKRHEDEELEKFLFENILEQTSIKTLAKPVEEKTFKLFLEKELSKEPVRERSFTLKRGKNITKKRFVVLNPSELIDNSTYENQSVRFKFIEGAPKQSLKYSTELNGFKPLFISKKEINEAEKKEEGLREKYILKSQEPPLVSKIKNSKKLKKTRKPKKAKKVKIQNIEEPLAKKNEISKDDTQTATTSIINKEEITEDEPVKEVEVVEDEITKEAKEVEQPQLPTPEIIETKTQLKEIKKPEETNPITPINQTSKPQAEVKKQEEIKPKFIIGREME